MIEINNTYPSQIKNTQINLPQFTNLLNHLKIPAVLKKANIQKAFGTPTMEILSGFFCIICNRSQSVSEGLKQLKIETKKSTFYDFLSKEEFNWRKLMLTIAKRYSNLYPSDEGKPSVLAIDDTSKPKTGKFVEHISTFYDHSKKIYYKGYQFVLAVLCNARTTIPVDFVLKADSGKSKSSKKRKKLKKNRVVNPKKRSKNARRRVRFKKSHQSNRVTESKKSKTALSIEMIKRALKHKIKFDYVLWDSWYNCSKSFKYVFNNLVPKKIHLISMVKLSAEKYRFLDKMLLNAKEIYKRAGSWKVIEENQIRYKSVIVEVTDKSITTRPATGKVKLCFYRFPGTKKYKAIISTNLDLSEEKILEYYLYRWSIEMVIKDLKQWFGFDHFKSGKYVSQIADLTIKCVFYTMLCSLREREPKKTMYIILFEINRELDNHFIEAINKLYFKNAICDFLEFTDSIGLTCKKELKALIRKCDKIVDDFFNSEFYEDKIIELDKIA